MYDLIAEFNDHPKDFAWSDSARESFQESRSLLSDVTTLSHPDPNGDNVHLVTDASQRAVGAALHQQIGVSHVPLGFYSKKLSKAQQVYSTFDRELLAAYQAVLHFKHVLEGRTVILFTDHKPLVSAFYSDTPCKTDRQQRHLSVISEYVSAVQYIKGADNIGRRPVALRR